MKTLPCGCSLTRDSWALCRAHYDAKEGRLAAFHDELERLESQSMDLEEELACACDLLNTWCRESGVQECIDPYNNNHLRDTIDRLWCKLSVDIGGLRATKERLEQIVKRVRSYVDIKSNHPQIAGEAWRDLVAALASATGETK